jgi:hypothetical protein
VALFNGSAGSTQLLADVAGYYLSGTPTVPGMFASTVPSRLLDTRSGSGATRPGPHGTVHLQVAGRGPVPAAVSAVVLNVRATEPTASGFITAYADATLRPMASNLNFGKDVRVSNLVVAQVGDDGEVSLFNGSSGTTEVTAATGGTGLFGVHIEVYDSTANLVGEAYSSTNGSYAVFQATPSASGYTVCFDASNASGGPSTTGYLDECYKGVAWDGGAVPDGVTLVVVTGGNTHPGISATLATGGAISGTVTAASGSAGLSSVGVEVFDSAGAFVYGRFDVSASNGSYTVRGLGEGTYTVCFQGSTATGGTSSTGYLNECYDDVAWNGNDNGPPLGTAPVSVIAAATHSGIDAGLLAAN